jgi:hypothetical protein
MKKREFIGMLKAHQIICGFFHPKLSRLRHQYSGTEHISFRTSCNFSYIFGIFIMMELFTCLILFPLQNYHAVPNKMEFVPEWTIANGYYGVKEI